MTMMIMRESKKTQISRTEQNIPDTTFNYSTTHNHALAPIARFRNLGYDSRPFCQVCKEQCRESKRRTWNGHDSTRSGSLQQSSPSPSHLCCAVRITDNTTTCAIQISDRLYTVYIIYVHKNTAFCSLEKSRAEMQYCFFFFSVLAGHQITVFTLKLNILHGFHLKANEYIILY